jgi:hypothetical protein
MKTLLEYAYARNPTATSIVSSPFTVTQLGANSIQIEFPWNWRATDLTWRIRSSSTLASC